MPPVSPGALPHVMVTAVAPTQEGIPGALGTSVRFHRVRSGPVGLDDPRGGLERHSVLARVLGDRGAQGGQGGRACIVVETFAHPAGEAADEVDSVVLVGPKLMGS